jgi:hypothetical protein
MRFITSAANIVTSSKNGTGASSNALPSSTWTVGEHINSGKKIVNPLQQDVELRRLLAALQSLESKRDFGRWKNSFLQRFETHLGIDDKGRSSMEAASAEYQRFGHAVVSLVTHVHKVEAILAQGDDFCASTTSSNRDDNNDSENDDDDDNAPVATTATSTSATVRARHCMVEFGKQLTAVITKIGQLIPGTVEKECIVGYTKFHMAAVLIKNGFQEYSSLTWCRGIFTHMRDVSFAANNDVCNDLQIMERLSHYSDTVDRFCDVMADLGLHDAMLKCEALFGDYSDSSSNDGDDGRTKKSAAATATTRGKRPRRQRSKYLSPPDSPVRNLVATRPPTAAEVLAALKNEKESAGQLVTNSSVVRTKSHGDWEWKLNGPPLSKNNNTTDDDKPKTMTTTITTTVKSSDKMSPTQETIVKKVQSQSSGKPAVIVEETTTTTFVVDTNTKKSVLQEQQQIDAMNDNNDESTAHVDDDDDDGDNEKEAAVEIVVEEKQNDKKTEPIEANAVSDKSEAAPAKAEKKPIGSLVGRWKTSNSNFVPTPEQWKAPTYKGHVANRYVPSVIRGGGGGPTTTTTTRTFNRRASLDSAAATNIQSSTMVTGYGSGGCGGVSVVAQSSSQQHPASVSRGPCFNRRASLDTSTTSQSSSTTEYRGDNVSQSAQQPQAYRRPTTFYRRASLDSSQPFTPSSRLAPESSTEHKTETSSETEHESNLQPESHKTATAAAAAQQIGVVSLRGSVASRYQPWAKSSSGQHSQQQPIVKRTFNRRASLDSNSSSFIPTTPSTTTNNTGNSIDERFSVQLPSSQSNKATPKKDDMQSEEIKPTLTSIAGRAGRAIDDRGINKQPSQTSPNARPSYRRVSIDCSRSTVSYKEAQVPEKTDHHVDNTTSSLQAAKNGDCSTIELPRGNHDEGDADEQHQQQKGSNDSDTGSECTQKAMEKVAVGLDHEQTSIVKSSKVKKTLNDDSSDDASCSSSSSSSISSSENVSDIDESLHRRLVKREQSLLIGKGNKERPFTGNNMVIEGKTWSKNKSDIQKPISTTKEEDSSTSSSEDDSQRHTVNSLRSEVVRDKSTFADDKHDLKGKQQRPSDINKGNESDNSNSSSSSSSNKSEVRVQLPKKEDSDDESDSSEGTRTPMKPSTPAKSFDTVEAAVIQRPSSNRRGSLESSQQSRTREKPKVKQPQQPAVKRSSVHRRVSVDSSTISSTPTAVGAMSDSSFDTVEAPVIQKPSSNRRGGLDSSQPSSIPHEKPKVEQAPQQPIVKRSSVNRRASLDSSTISKPPTLEVKKEQKSTTSKDKDSKRKKEEKKSSKKDKKDKDDKKDKSDKKEKKDNDDKKDKSDKKEKKDNDDKKDKSDIKEKKAKKEKKEKNSSKLKEMTSTGEEKEKVKKEQKEKTSKKKKKVKQVDVS